MGTNALCPLEPFNHRFDARHGSWSSTGGRLGCAQHGLSAWQHSGLVSRRIPLLPRQIRGTRLILWLAPSRSAWRPPQKDPLQIKYAATEIWKGMHTEKRCIWSIRRLLARGIFGAAGKKNRAARLMKPWEGKLWRASPFPIILVKYTAWESTQAQRAVNLGLVIKSSLSV